MFRQRQPVTLAPIEIGEVDRIITEEIPNGIVTRSVKEHEEMSKFRFDEVTLQDMIANDLPLKQVPTIVINSHLLDQTDKMLQSFEEAQNKVQQQQSQQETKEE